MNSSYFVETQTILGLNWFYEGRFVGSVSTPYWSGYKRVGSTDVYRDQDNGGQFLKKNCLNIWAAGEPTSYASEILVLFQSVCNGIVL